MIADIRFAFRLLRRAPAFATAAILTLAIGIGANTAIFSMVHGFFRPLPAPSPDQIMVLAAVYPGDESGFRYRFSYPALADFRSQSTTFSDVFGFDTRLGGLTANGRTAQFVYQVVTGNLFTGLGLKPAAGRLFRPGEGEVGGADAVIVLSYGYWQTRFGASQDVIGQSARLDGQPARIIGVAPEGFHGLYEGADMEGYLPIGAPRGRSTQGGQLFVDRTIKFLTMLGRLKPNVTIQAAQTEVDTIAARLRAQYPATERDMTVRVMPEPMARPVPLRFLSTRLPVIRMLLMVLAALVLLLACMNVANLLLVRATVRQREIAVRAGLGADRNRLVRLLLAESLLLAALGGAGGLVVGKWASDAFLATIDVAMDIPLNLDFRFDWTVFGYALATAAATGMVMGLLPAMRASRPNVMALLHDGGRSDTSGAGRQRVRSLLVVSQVAGSLVLLIVAGLFVRSLQQAQRIDLGFDANHLLSFRLDPHQIGYTEERSETFYDELDRRLRAVPGVDSVAMAFSVPMGYIMAGCPVQPEGRPPIEQQSQPIIGCNWITPEYFDTLRLPLRSGRAFTKQDTRTSTHVAIVNETLAQRLWPGEDPLGKRFTIASRLEEGAWQIVGVAHNSKFLAVFEDPLPFLYLPMAQDPSFMRVIHLRSDMPPAALSASAQREVERLDPDLPIADMKTMRQTLSGGMGFLMFRVGAMQASALGLLGLLLAVVGVYGVVSYGASQRVREIGIRLALGAEPADVGQMVLRQGAILVIGGIFVGLIAAAILTRVTARFLLLVSTTDPLTFSLVTAVLTAIALFACYLPARRAMRVDPMVALRHE